MKRLLATLLVAVMAIATAPSSGAQEREKTKRIMESLKERFRSRDAEHPKGVLPDTDSPVRPGVAPPSDNVSWDPATATLKAGDYEYTFVKIKGGTFDMGATGTLAEESQGNDLPVHKVKLSSYYIGTSEVPQWLWEAVMGSNPSRWQKPLNPVEMVSWHDCIEFISRLNELTDGDCNFALPTEAQWEYAAREASAKCSTRYSGSDKIGEVAWYASNGNERTHPVMSRKPNALGIYDMTGNVLEWCADWEGTYDPQLALNPQGPPAGYYRIVRGGSWYGAPEYCQISFRGSFEPLHADDNVGLRLVFNPSATY